MPIPTEEGWQSAEVESEQRRVREQASWDLVEGFVASAEEEKQKEEETQ